MMSDVPIIVVIIIALAGLFREIYWTQQELDKPSGIGLPLPDHVFKEDLEPEETDQEACLRRWKEGIDF